MFGKKVTKYELSILRRLAMAQEKPEGGLKGPPPARNRVKMLKSEIEKAVPHSSACSFTEEGFGLVIINPVRQGW